MIRFCGFGLEFMSFKKAEKPKVGIWGIANPFLNKR